MSDLISRSKLYMNDLIRRNDVLALFPINDCSDKMVGLYERVLDIPTAYDKEAVVEQLREQSDYEPIDYDYCDMACSDEQYFIATDKAIEIVKGGGIDGIQ